MFSKLRILSVALTLAFSSTAFADLAIIGHPDSEVGNLDTQKVKKLFLGERKSFPNGLHATPMNHVKGSPDRKEFFASVLNMPESRHSRHWKRKISTGSGSSPEDLSSYTEVLKSVSKTPGSISYIDSSHVDDSVKVLFTISDIEVI